MNANEKFLASSAQVDEAAVAPLPNSRKIYVEGSRPDIRVPMREISQADTPTGFGGEKNPPIFVYDCSGPYTDPAARIDIRSGATISTERMSGLSAERHSMSGILMISDLSPCSFVCTTPVKRQLAGGK